jgi:hypothetical protein
LCYWLKHDRYPSLKVVFESMESSWLILLARIPTTAWLLTFALLATTPIADGAILQATMTGGLISGDLGGTPFSDAPYTLTAGYDPSLVQSGSLAGFPANFVAVTPTLTIDTGSGPLSSTLLPFAGFTWHVFSLAVTANISRSGFVPIDANLNVTNAFDIDAAQPQSTLLAELAFGGDSDANDPATWQTSLGTLDITASTDAAGTFVIVPEPSTMAALGIALVALAGRRRFIKA